MQKPKNIGELNRLYSEADRIDRPLFAEQRSNILLVAGDHYNKSRTPNYRQLRDNRDLSRNQKLRLTQNWTHKVQRRQANWINKYSGKIKVLPKIPSSAHSQKVAEMDEAVYQDGVHRYRLNEVRRRAINDFTTIGEVFIKVWWDPDKGDIVGYEQKVDDFGYPILDEMGQPVRDENLPAYSGAFVFERLYGFNILRAPEAQSMEESPYVINRKMASIEELKLKYKDDEDIVKSLHEGQGDEYVIFESTKGGYDKSKGQVPIREYYFRPCRAYPKGYFFIATPTVILEEGTLPYGVFPITFGAWDEHPTSPRGRSSIKQVRPFQAEVNRASSSQAQHQITVGDDKILHQAGTKLAPGALLPGVRSITYQGMAPQILPGRDGSQYTGYITQKKDEMFDLTDTYDIAAPNNDKGGTDIYAMLFKSSTQRQALSIYSERFEQFWVDTISVFLKLARKYYEDDMVIVATGKDEIINIPEYRNSDPMEADVTVVPMDDTLESVWGKQLTLQNYLQYAGAQLSPDQIGAIMKHMPFANHEEIFQDLTLDSDIAQNTILALERGEYLPTNPEENHDYMAKKLSARMKKPDFAYLDPQIQQMFQQKRQEHLQIKQQQDAQALAANADYIPIEGAKIGVDMYVEDKMHPEKAPKRARIPESALQWLMERIEQQSGPLMGLQDLPPAAQAEYAGLRQQAMGPPQGQLPPQMPQVPMPGQGAM